MSKRKQPAVSTPVEALAALAAPAAPAATAQQELCAVAVRMAGGLRTGRDITVGLAADVTLLVAAHPTAKDAGTALRAAWASLNEKADALPIRMLVEACYLAGITRADASPLCNAVKAVAKQRVSQLVAVIYDGNKAANKGKPAKGGKADKADKAAPKGGKSESQDGLDQLVETAPKAAPKAAPTVEDVLALIAELPALTAADASRIAVALKGKLA